MTKEAIRLCLKRQELYDSPELNERLYLHHKKFMEIRNLEKFTQVKYLYLESNCLTKIDKLNAQKYLQSLHLQDNKLGEMSPTLSLKLPLLLNLAEWISVRYLFSQRE